jgi:alkylation response protein AidB-like acyl-CoA dehydrogenase
MRFVLTDSQRELRDEVREFASNEIRPRAAELSRNGEYPAEILSELGERRLTGLTLPEAYGGRGEGLVELAIVVEELSAVMMPVASALALSLGVATIVDRFGTDEQREAFLPGMARFEMVGALGLSEERAGSDKLAMETTAERDGDEWTLNGRKRWVTNFPEADVVLTYAKTGAGGDAPHNVSAFLVPAAEFELAKTWETFGANSVATCEVTLSDVRVPADRMVGAEGEAYVQRGRLATGVNVPARGVGIARAALEDSVAFASEREQFGRPLGDFQGLRWTLAEMASRVDAARLLTLRAADLADRGRDAGRALPTAKVNATEAAVENANDAMQIHGGIGYTSECEVGRYLRDARLLTIAGGPNEVHKNGLADALFEAARSGN